VSPGDEKSLMISSARFDTLYANVTDRETDGRTPHDCKDRAMQWFHFSQSLGSNLIMRICGLGEFSALQMSLFYYYYYYNLLSLPPSFPLPSPSFPSFRPFPCNTARGLGSAVSPESGRKTISGTLKFQICAFFASQAEFLYLCFVTK